MVDPLMIGKRRTIMVGKRKAVGDCDMDREDDGAWDDGWSTVMDR